MVEESEKNYYEIQCRHLLTDDDDDEKFLPIRNYYITPMFDHYTIRPKTKTKQSFYTTLEYEIFSLETFFYFYVNFTKSI